MNKIFQKNSAIILSICALLFLAGLIASYIWGISYLVANERKAGGSSNEGTPPIQFNLDKAGALNYRGLL